MMQKFNNNSNNSNNNSNNNNNSDNNSDGIDINELKAIQMPGIW